MSNDTKINKKTRNDQLNNIKLSYSSISKSLSSKSVSSEKKGENKISPKGNINKNSYSFYRKASVSNSDQSEQEIVLPDQQSNVLLIDQNMNVIHEVEDDDFYSSIN